ncbi:TonB-dependent receptor plug domain-containing protein, partial [Povalibacter sp.]|uniref:TonB-dependent receptor plug domain-containing protein n=1 Tax=Povalibacter sp. TaxID=1962978 RepID=UPI002F42E8A5
MQDIPLAISAFSQEQIQEAGFRDLGDLALQTPGMAFNPRSGGVRAGRVDSRIRLRGVTSDSHLDHLQPTSLFIDGIFVLGTANSIGLQDLERVEVIKGPQSAFFGRNTFAGAINFITRNPDLYEFRTELDMSAASYEKYDVSALHSGPLIPGKLAYQVNTRAYRRGSEWTATDGGELGVESSNFFSGVLYAEPIENLSMKFRAYFQRDDDGPPAAGMIRSRDIDTCSGKTFTRLD